MKCFGIIIVTILLMVLTGCQTMTTREISSNEPLQQWSPPTPKPTTRHVEPVQVQQQELYQQPVENTPVTQEYEAPVQNVVAMPQNIQSEERTFFSFDCALGTIKYILYTQTDERGVFKVITICLTYSGKSSAQNVSPRTSRQLQAFFASNPDLVQEFEDGPALPLYQAFVKDYQFDRAHKEMWNKLSNLYLQFGEGVSMTHLVYLHPNVMQMLQMTGFTSHEMLQLMRNSTDTSFSYNWRKDVDTKRKKIYFTKNKRVNDAIKYAMDQMLAEERS